ncbi:hypothetical protein [Sphingobium yanoikuyae]|uniref:hypothetical protein n=1 Tax=Sphingobium yanoikuyae TaxID=13690 RepID=UPI0022DD09B6|nr:hypothetical protein [Sphingobium yanoikuyae]WBQ19071.1 hypothetical protein PAE53_24875 [Sphingobium yanoikuyae]
MAENLKSKDDLAIEFQRDIDGLIYSFNRDGERNGKPKWRRVDLNLELHWSDNWGWILTDEDGNLLSVSWERGKDQQGNTPPDGVWVSRKGSKSYVYGLRYVGAAVTV